MSNGYQKSNGCNADKEGWKFLKTKKGEAIK